MAKKTRKVQRSDNFKKYFRDPIYNFIPITEKWILELINSKEFQRLRHIRQLGTSEVTYYGANHTRFSHSIGTNAFESA